MLKNINFNQKIFLHRLILFSVLFTIGDNPINPYFTKSLLAQTPNLPKQITNQNQTILIDGSNSMLNINQLVQKNLESQNLNTKIQAQYKGTDIALKLLQDDKIDLAAIGRYLTEQEQNQGLKTISVSRQKIAVIVGVNNPLQGSITTQQFAQIFRGEITNWSELGGVNKPIRFIDLPLISDTRQALKNYPVFQQAEFKNGVSVERISADNTDELIKNLGTDGIGYTITDQAINQSEIRIIPLNNVSVQDPRYSFSQPRFYVYKTPINPRVQFFLNNITKADTLIENSPIISPPEVQQKLPKSNNNNISPPQEPPKSNHNNWAFWWFLLLFVPAILLGWLIYLWKNKKFNLSLPKGNFIKSNQDDVLGSQNPQSSPLNPGFYLIKVPDQQQNSLNHNPSIIPFLPSENIINNWENVIIIHIDARINNQDNPVIKFINSGTYYVKMLGKNQGGLNEGWSAWDFVYGGDENGENCLTGWLNSYNISSREFNLKIPTTNIYSLQKLALINAYDNSFTLQESQEVSFLIEDNQLEDNRGGISLAIIPISQVVNSLVKMPNQSVNQSEKNTVLPKLPEQDSVLVYPFIKGVNQGNNINVKLANITPFGFDICLLNQDNQQIINLGWLIYNLDNGVNNLTNLPYYLQDININNKHDELLIINIDAMVNSWVNPVIKILPSGIYEIKVIGTDQGGKYDGWSRWNFVYECDQNGENCITGWLNSYCLNSQEFNINIPTTGIYENALKALKNAQNSYFTLTTDTPVSFFIDDDYLNDNQGGISLIVRKISEVDKENIRININPVTGKILSIFSTVNPTEELKVNLVNNQGKKIVIATYGSFGDLYPYIAIALELKNRGYYPIIAGDELFRHQVEIAGLEFQPLRQHFALDSLQGREWKTVLQQLQRSTEHTICYDIMPHVRATYTDLLKLVENADLLITHHFCFVGSLIAQKTGIPWISTILSPLSFQSVYNLSTSNQSPVSIYEETLKLVSIDGQLRSNRCIVRHWSGPLRELQQELGLFRGCDPLFEGQHSPDLVLALFSGHFTPPQPDWPPQTWITGFPFYDGHNHQKISPELEHFLISGTPPIVFTLGSALVWTPGNFYLESALAMAKLGYRAVLMMGNGAESFDKHQLPEGVIVVNYAPHNDIFPKALAIVHHGGVGTTAQALRAGRPMLIVPHAHDQPDNGNRLVNLGVGRMILPQDYTTEGLVRELEELLNNSNYRIKAEEISKLIQSENGVNTACDAIAAYFEFNKL